MAWNIILVFKLQEHLLLNEAVDEAKK